MLTVFNGTPGTARWTLRYWDASAPGATIRVAVKKFAPILIGLLLHVPSAAGAADQRTSNLSVVFGPEVELTRQSTVVHLKIRLSEGGSARIWLADNCTAPQEDGAASYQVGESGEFEIPMANLPGHGSRVCLKSTDRLTADATSGQPAASAEAKAEEQ